MLSVHECLKLKAVTQHKRCLMSFSNFQVVKQVVDLYPAEDEEHVLEGSRNETGNKENAREDSDNSRTKRVDQ